MACPAALRLVVPDLQQGGFCVQAGPHLGRQVRTAGGLKHWPSLPSCKGLLLSISSDRTRWGSLLISWPRWQPVLGVTVAWGFNNLQKSFGWLGHGPQPDSHLCSQWEKLKIRRPGDLGFDSGVPPKPSVQRLQKTAQLLVIFSSSYGSQPTRTRVVIRGSARQNKTEHRFTCPESVSRHITDMSDPSRKPPFQ